MINEINGRVIILGCMVMHVSAGWILEEAQPRTQGPIAGNLGGSHWRNQSRDMVALVTYWRSTRGYPCADGRDLDEFFSVFSPFAF
jgi:metal-dependent hydrolase (beta-lactamase superfamily II)